MTRRVSVFERLVCARAVEAETNCWVWTGSRDDKGYGRIWHNGKNRRVHIVSFELATGRALKPGHTVEHTCRNTSCWRPSHLEELTRAENTARGNRAKPRSTAAATVARRLERKHGPFAIDIGAALSAVAPDPVFDDGHGGSELARIIFRWAPRADDWTDSTRYRKR